MPPESATPHSFLCFGVGAIGTYIGGSLALAGSRVVFIERPGPAAEIRQSGLTLDLPEGSRRVEQPQIVESVQAALALGPFDAGLLAVKAYDTLALAESLRPFAAALPPIVSFQNGVENEAVLASVLGAEKVIAATVTTAIGRKGAGHVAVERLRGIGIAANRPLGAALVPVAAAAGLRARAYPNPRAMKWSKMLTNLLGNATSAILDLPPAAIFGDPALYQLEVHMLREALAVMRAQSIPVIDLPATPVRLLAFFGGSFAPRLSQPILRRALGSGRGAKMPSFHIDLYSGRGKSEVDYLNGAVVRAGERAGVPTPVNRALTEILMRLTTGAVEMGTYAHHPERLLAEIPSN